MALTPLPLDIETIKSKQSSSYERQMFLVFKAVLLVTAAATVQQRKESCQHGQNVDTNAPDLGPGLLRWVHS